MVNTTGGGYRIGGDARSFGQEVDIDYVTSLLAPTTSPAGGLVGGLAQMKDILHSMPLEVLQKVQPFFGKTSPFNSVGHGVAQIMDSFGDLDDPKPQFLRKTSWKEWLDSIFHPTNSSHTSSITNLNDQFLEWLTGSANTGNSATEAFSGYPNGGPGSKWSSWYSGGLASATIEINAGRLRLPNIVLTNRKGWTRYTAKATQTDYQKVGASFATKPATGLLGATAHNRILGRLSNSDGGAGTAYVFGELGETGASLGCNVNGSETVFGTLPSFKFNPGSAYWLQCGVKNAGADALRTYRLYENNALLLERIDSAGRALTGASQRFTGLGFDNPNLQSANVSSFAMHDN